VIPVIVAAAAGAVIILDVAIIIDPVKMVAAAAAKKQVSFLLRPFISLPSMNKMDNRIPLIESRRK
jgi:hypothetical protein